MATLLGGASFCLFSKHLEGTFLVTLFREASSGRFFDLYHLYTFFFVMVTLIFKKIVTVQRRHNSVVPILLYLLDRVTETFLYRVTEKWYIIKGQREKLGNGKKGNGKNKLLFCNHFFYTPPKST